MGTPLLFSPPLAELDAPPYVYYTLLRAIV